MKPRVRRRPWLGGLLAAAMAWGPSEAAFASPAIALQYVAPESLDALETVADEEADLRFTERIGFAVTFEPDITYFDDLDDEEEGGLDADLGVEAEIGYTWNRRSIVTNEIQVIEARARAGLLRRNGVEAALVGYADLLQAQLLVEGRTEQVAASAAGVADAEARLEAGEATVLDVERSRLTLEEAELYFGVAERGLEQARARAREFGLTPPVDYESARFVLPARRAEDTDAARRLQLRVHLAEAAYDQATIFEAVNTLAATATYSTGDVSVRTSVGILEGNPRAEVGFALPEDDHAWSVGVSAEITLGSGLRSAGDYAEGIEAARAELAAFLVEFPSLLANARAAAEVSEAQLGIDERRLAAAVARVAEAETAVAEAEAALEEAGEEVRAESEGRLEGAREALATARREAAAARGRVYGVFEEYVRRVGDYLDLAEARWTLRE